MATERPFISLQSFLVTLRSGQGKAEVRPRLGRCIIECDRLERELFGFRVFFQPVVDSGQVIESRYPVRNQFQGSRKQSFSYLKIIFFKTLQTFNKKLFGYFKVIHEKSLKSRAHFLDVVWF
ncbi:MAG TPA: hypothetical protein VGR14_11820 [Verrucomicrobiae bacterium]|nr:hypothetical protein [Verrucomicrobiae bacterium]